MKKRVATCTMHRLQAFKWINQLEEPGAKFEDFEHAGGFLNLDSQLLSACEKIIPNGHEIRERVRYLEAEWQKTKAARMVSGTR